MKKFLIFIGGFIVGILVTFLVGYLLLLTDTHKVGIESNPDKLPGLTVFPEKGDCITTTSKSESSEINIFQVVVPNAALASLQSYTDEKIYDDKTFRVYDRQNEIVVLLINYDGKTYYDDQKIDVSNNCIIQVGLYQYTTQMDNLRKTIPAVVIE